MDGYVFRPAELNAVRDEWVELLKELEVDAASAQRLIELEAPADEPASRRMTAVGVSSGNEFLRHNAATRAFVQTYVDELTRARDAYVRDDENARGAFRNGGE